MRALRRAGIWISTTRDGGIRAWGRERRCRGLIPVGLRPPRERLQHRQNVRINRHAIQLSAPKRNTKKPSRRYLLSECLAGML